MPLVDALNRHPAGRRGARHWPALVAATLALAGIGGVAVAREPALPGMWCAFGAAAALLGASWFARWAGGQGTAGICPGPVPEQDAAARSGPALSPMQIVENPLGVMELML